MSFSAIYDALCAAGWGAYVGFDLGLVHQLDYYTGMVFCGYVEEAAMWWSPAGGTMR